MGSSTAGSCERTVQGHIHMADRQVRRHADPLNALPAEAKARLRKRPQPEWVAPMLATLTQKRFSREGWLFEPKWDGERCIAVRRGRKLSLFSRNRILLNVKYPEIVTALDQQETGSFIADGEIVTFKDGITSFAKLQERMQVAHPSPDPIRQVPVWLYLFDVVYFECYDTRQLVPDTADTRKVLSALGVTPHHVIGDRFQAKVRRERARGTKLNPARRRAKQRNIR
jgi:ATP-dependent DNA ligase